LILGVLAGGLLVIGAGDGQPGGATVLLSNYDAGEIGIAEDIRLPRDARKLTQLSSFLISIGDEVDDFVEVFVNNYLVFKSEDKIFRLGDERVAERLNTKFIRLGRGNPISKTASVKKHLRAGKNIIMAQLVNSRLGDCEMTLSMSVNGQVLEGFPRHYPDAIDLQQFETADPKKDGIRPRLASQLRELAKGRSNPAENLSDATEAICSRRFFVFELH
jgi:hypothetical protein